LALDARLGRQRATVAVSEANQRHFVAPSAGRDERLTEAAGEEAGAKLEALIVEAVTKPA
jgi:hypothetical protein